MFGASLPTKTSNPGFVRSNVYGASVEKSNVNRKKTPVLLQVKEVLVNQKNYFRRPWFLELLGVADDLNWLI